MRQKQPWPYRDCCFFFLEKERLLKTLRHLDQLGKQASGVSREISLILSLLISTDLNPKLLPWNCLMAAIPGIILNLLFKTLCLYMRYNGAKNVTFNSICTSAPTGPLGPMG